MAKNRSPTARDIAMEMAQRRGISLEACCVGMMKPEMPDEIKKDYDKIFVFEEWMRNTLLNKYHMPEERVVFLNVPDMYSRFNARQKKELEGVLEGLLGQYI
jgi:predicted protein tyrosine phosphatase